MSDKPPTEVDESVKRYLAYGIVQEAMAQLKARVAWILGVIVFVLAALGIKTYVDISTYIENATQAQIEEAKKQTDTLLTSFAQERDQTLQRFKDSSEQALDDFQARVDQVIADLEAPGSQAIVEIESRRTEVLASIDALQLTPDDPSLSVRTVSRRERYRPIGPGLSVSSLETTAGTICCILKGRTDDAYYLLTTSFTLVSESNLRRGPPNGIGEVVIQPGRVDGGDTSDAIATVSAYSTVGPDPDDQSDNVGFRTAVALAQIDDGVEFYSDVPEIGVITGLSETVSVGEEVVAYGRTSGVTRGTVTAADATLNVYIAPGVQQLFTDLIVVARSGQSITQPGDAGAPVLNADNELIGIAYGGSATSTIIMPIGPILEEFDIELVTGPPPEE